MDQFSGSLLWHGVSVQTEKIFFVACLYPALCVKFFYRSSFERDAGPPVLIKLNHFPFEQGSPVLATCVLDAATATANCDLISS